MSSSQKKYISDFVKKLYRSKGRYGLVQLDPRDILRETDSGLWIVRRAIDEYIICVFEIGTYA
jgi:hypothetical protein